MGEFRKIAEFYKALGDETRLAILEMLAEQELCACEIIARLKMSQPAISHHFKILRQAELVNDKKEGKWIFYSLNERVFEEVFRDYGLAVSGSYAQPIRDRLSKLKPSIMRDENAVCLLEIKEE